ACRDRSCTGDVRAGDGERIGADVCRPHLRVRQLRRQRDRERPGTGAEVRDREAGRAGAPGFVAAAPDTESFCFLERDDGDDLGLGPWNEYAPVDEQIVAEELPATEHVLQRLAPPPP